MFTRILVPLDGSTLAEQALGRAMAIARASGASMDLTLVHQPFPFDGVTDAVWASKLDDVEREYLETIDGEVRSGGDINVTHAVLDGDPVARIAQRVQETGADLVVMTTHARTGLSRAWLGSVADGLVRHATVPVLALRPVAGSSRHDASRHLFEHVLVAMDGSPESADVLPSVSRVAQCSRARVTLLRVVQPIPIVTMEVGLPSAYTPALFDDPNTRRLAAEARDELAETARHFEARSGLRTSAHVVVDSIVATGIIDAARGFGCDLIAMATHGRGLSRVLMGSVADKVMRAGAQPMLVYRPVHVRQEEPVPVLAGAAT